MNKVIKRLLPETSEAYIKDIEEHIKESTKYARG